MKYIKPRIISTSRAASAIQGLAKANPLKTDSMHQPSTTTAYEADE
jgi:hypothetical protein